MTIFSYLGSFRVVGYALRHANPAVSQIKGIQWNNTPQRLVSRVNNFYRSLFDVVQRNHGSVSDVDTSFPNPIYTNYCLAKSCIYTRWAKSLSKTCLREGKVCCNRTSSITSRLNDCEHADSMHENFSSLIHPPVDKHVSHRHIYSCLCLIVRIVIWFSIKCAATETINPKTRLSVKH